jgi:hypothetical protein
MQLADLFGSRRRVMTTLAAMMGMAMTVHPLWADQAAWTGAGDAILWTDASNWDTAPVYPNSADTNVHIDGQAAPATVLLDTSVTAADVTIYTDDQLTISGLNSTTYLHANTLTIQSGGLYDLLDGGSSDNAYNYFSAGFVNQGTVRAQSSTAGSTLQLYTLGGLSLNQGSALIEAVEAHVLLGFQEGSFENDGQIIARAAQNIEGFRPAVSLTIGSNPNAYTGVNTANGIIRAETGANLTIQPLNGASFTNHGLIEGLGGRLYFVPYGDSVFTNHGSIRFQDDTDGVIEFSNPDVFTRPRFVNSSTGILEVLNNTLRIGPGGDFINQGSIVVDQSTLTIDMSYLDGNNQPSVFDNSAGSMSVSNSTFIVAGGTVALANTTLSNNNYQLNAGNAVLDLAGQSLSISGSYEFRFMSAGSSTVRNGAIDDAGGQGAIVVAANTWGNFEEMTVDGRIQNETNAVTNFTGNLVAGPSNILVNAVTPGDTYALSFTNAQFNSGSLTVNDAFYLNGSLTTAINTEIILQGSGRPEGALTGLTNHGIITVAGVNPDSFTPNQAFLRVLGGDTLTNYNTIRVQDGAILTIGAGLPDYGITGGVIDNQGSISADGYDYVNNQLAPVAPQLVLYNLGTWTNSNGGSVSVANNATLVMRGGYFDANAGFQINNANLTVEASTQVNMTGTSWAPAADRTFLFRENAYLYSGYLGSASQGTMLVSNYATFDNMGFDGPMQVEPYATIRLTGDTYGSSYAVINNSQPGLDPGIWYYLDFDGLSVVQDTLELRDVAQFRPGMFNVRPNGTLVFDGDFNSDTGYSNNFNNEGTLIVRGTELLISSNTGGGSNSGSLSVEGTAALVLHSDPDQFTSYYNEGTFVVTSQATANVTQGGYFSVTNNGELRVDGSFTSFETLVLQNGGQLSGTGIVIANVDNQGIVSPGSSPGSLTIDGDLTTIGALVFDIAGPSAGDFDHLLVTGDVYAGGVIHLVLQGYDPLEGDTFDLLDFLSFSALDYSFDLSQAVLASHLVWNTSGFARNGSISVQGIPEPTTLAALVLMSLGLGKRRRR